MPSVGGFELDVEVGAVMSAAEKAWSGKADRSPHGFESHSPLSDCPAVLLDPAMDEDADPSSAENLMPE